MSSTSPIMRGKGEQDPLGTLPEALSYTATFSVLSTRTAQPQQKCQQHPNEQEKQCQGPSYQGYAPPKGASFKIGVVEVGFFQQEIEKQPEGKGYQQRTYSYYVKPSTGRGRQYQIGDHRRIERDFTGNVNTDEKNDIRNSVL